MSYLTLENLHTSAYYLFRVYVRTKHAHWVITLYNIEQRLALVLFLQTWYKQWAVSTQDLRVKGLGSVDQGSRAAIAE